MNQRQINLADLRNRAEAAIADVVHANETSLNFDGQGDVTHLVEELRIYQTELELQNQELELSQHAQALAAEKYRTLFEYLPLPALLMDERGFIIEANRHCIHFLGLQRSFQQQNYAFTQFVGDGRRLEVFQALGIKSKEPNVIRNAKIRSRAQGVINCDIQISALEALEDMSVARFLVLLIDRSIELALENKNRDLELAIEMAETANRAKSTFLSMTSHELRTPMSGVMGMLNILKTKTEAPELLELVKKAERASRQLLSVINDVLDMSRIESNRLELHQQTFSVDQLKESLLDAVGYAAQSNGLTIEFDIPEKIGGIYLIGDSVRINQILVNIVANAVKFANEGQISITASFVMNDHISLGGAQLRFDIVDQGIGIAPEHLSRIFLPFEQVDSSLSRPFTGTGLGLSLCKSLVEAMHGQIGVESTPNVGSHFWFYVEVELTNQLNDRTVLSTAPEKELLERHRGKTLFLVEDDPVVQEITQYLLEPTGLVIVTLNDGQAAVCQLETQRPDIVLMDMSMPHMDGITATRLLRKMPHHRRTPIIAMSANAFDDDKLLCLEAGMNDHLGKPVQPQQLYGMLLKWLDEA